ncbi:MAG TPA: WD40 repeat domain-containing protein, partial [Pseudonocardiaceae bacterium]|nr:WD40 repeat domain-containing protein [Pseudonocardiaceae bacterium]
LAEELLRAGPDGPRRRLLVVVDQLEELFTQAAPHQRARFAELVRPGLNGPVRVVATLRPEFLDQLLADPELAVLAVRAYPLRPLRREALRLVIEGPAQLVGIMLEEHLVARLVEDTGGGEALPLLAFTLAQLAEGVSRGGQLSIARYEQLGGVPGALARQADVALIEAMDRAGRNREDVVDGLLRLVTVDEQGSPTCWRARRDELPASVLTEWDAFVARRLLSTDTDDGTVVISVAHEAFLSAWFPLAQAITANVAALRARRAVEHAAAGWDGDGRPTARLWSGGELAAAVADTGARICAGGASLPGRQGSARWLLPRHRMLVSSRVELSARAREFLHAGIRRDRSRRRRATTILSVAIVLALLAAGVALGERSDAEQGQRIATADRLLRDAEAARSTDLRAALLRELAAHSLHPTAETRASLVSTFAAGPYLSTLTGHISAVNSISLTPDGHTLATGSHDSTVILWDLTDPAAPRRLGPPLTGHNKPVNSVAFTPDGRTLATGGDDHTVILWDVTDRARPRQLGSPLTGHTGAVTTMALAPDGRTLITGSADHTVIRWDLTDLAHPRQLGQPLIGHAGAVRSVALAADGHTLATGGDDHTVILWDVTDLAQPRRLGQLLRTDAYGVSAVAFAPTGRMLATSTKGETVLWDLTDPAHPHQLGPPLRLDYSLVNFVGLMLSVAFAPDSRSLAISTSNGATVLWDLTDPAHPYLVGPPLTGHTRWVNTVAFTADGRTLTTGSADGTVILWDLADQVQPRRLGPPLAGHGDLVWSVAFAPHGQTLATASEDRSVILWDVTDPVRPRRLGSPLTGHTGGVVSVAFSPDGRSVVTGSVDTTAILWDVTDPGMPRQLGPPLTGHAGWVHSVVFSPDGRTVATGNDNQTVILWDVVGLAQPRRLGPPLTAGSGGVTSVAFSPDGRTLAAGTSDSAAILWDVTDPAQPHPLSQPLTSYLPVLSVVFSPDGRTLATSGIDATVTLWDLTRLNYLRDHAVRRACIATRGGPDRAEWDHYLSGLPYQDSCPG